MCKLILKTYCGRFCCILIWAVRVFSTGETVCVSLDLNINWNHDKKLKWLAGFHTRCHCSCEATWCDAMLASVLSHGASKRCVIWYAVTVGGWTVKVVTQLLQRLFAFRRGAVPIGPPFLHIQTVCDSNSCWCPSETRKSEVSFLLL